jgi:hypothetical protein
METSKIKQETIYRSVTGTYWSKLRCLDIHIFVHTYVCTSQKHMY